MGPLLWIVSLATIAIGVAFFHEEKAFAQTDAAADDAPVVLELFTSEGCSSCPPADALLSQLGSSDKRLIPLAFHVDYWNHLGWSDPFSSPQWSERQSAYAHTMNVSGDYTPQMVIDGGWQGVGSDRRSIEGAVRAARSEAALDRITLHTNLDAAKPRTLQVKVNVQILRTSVDAGPLVVMLAIYESGLISNIESGENGGRQLTYDYTVRRLLSAFELKAEKGTTATRELNIDLDPGWSVDHLGAVAFIQDLASMRIDGATAEYPIARN